MNDTELLKAYLDRLSADTGFDIMIECKYGILANDITLNSYIAAVKWHCNPYCLTVKKSNRIHSLCVTTKNIRWKNIQKNPVACWHVCHCGVAEYIVPIVVNGYVTATIFATGFVGKISDNMKKIIAKNTKIPQEELDRIRNMALSEPNDEILERLNCYLTVAAEILKRIALKAPLVQSLSKEENTDESQHYVLKAIDFIEKNYYKDINVEIIAKHCHISASHLQHLFLKYYNEGISTVLRKKRMENACELLCNSTRSVRDIAISCGFYDTDYFSVAFKRMYNISPLTFRKKHIANI